MKKIIISVAVILGLTQSCSYQNPETPNDITIEMIDSLSLLSESDTTITDSIH
jgi:hypothetical protein